MRTGRVVLAVVIAAGAILGATVGRKKIVELGGKAKQAWQRPRVQEKWRRANRFVAEKAQTLHDVGDAVVDAIPKRSRQRQAPATS